MQGVALVTGGSRGIGRGICLALAREGYRVLVNFNNNIAAAQETLEMIEREGGVGEICQGDVSIHENRELLVDFCLETFGRLDVLVNNAGIGSPGNVDLLDVNADSLDRVLEVNLKAPLFLSQRAARIMMAQIEQGTSHHATIINISSIRTFGINVTRSEYCISKAGLSMLTTLFAARLAEHNIYVYELRPSFIETDLTSKNRKHYDQLIRDGIAPIRRWGQPADIGKAVAMLARGDLPFSTGEVINIDGGLHIQRI